MNEAAHAPLTAWTDFYAIVGSAAAALTGLQFVVIALIKDLQRPRQIASGFHALVVECLP